MPPAVLALTVVLGIALIVLAIKAIIASNKRRRERIAALALYAAQLGCSFNPQRDRSRIDDYNQFAALRQGHSRVAFNTIAGTVIANDMPYQVRTGDYEYKITTSNGKTTTTTTYRLSYLIVHPPMGPMPDLHIRPENLLDKLAGAVGFDDIDFESAEFSKRFFVKSPDKKFAYDVISPTMMEFLLASDHKAISIENSTLLITLGTRRWEPQEFRDQLDWTLRFLDLWPDYLVDDLTA